MRFRNLAASARPSSQNVSDDSGTAAEAHTSLTEIVASLRGTNGHDEPDDSEEWVVREEQEAFPQELTVPDQVTEQTVKPRSLLRRKTG
ncbi:MAG: hypothetical protein NXH88_09115 [Hyphomonas sp.]|nr:hypothetical protein [Hyphomonas sp.]